MEFIESSAKTIEEATRKGLAKLEEMKKNFERSEIIEVPSNGFLGFGKKDALVRMYYTNEVSILEEILATEEPGATEKSSEDEIAQAIVADIAKEEEKPAVPVQEVVTEMIAEEVIVEKEPATNEEKAVLTVEKQHEIANKAKTFLQEMLEQMDLDVVIEKMTTFERITLQVHGENLGIIIGKHGQTLEAIQYLTNLVANKGEHARCHIMVDVGGYRARREITLQQLACRLAAKVRRNRHKVSLEPMNAYERKIIHTALQDMPHIETSSEGEGASRHIVVKYVK